MRSRKHSSPVWSDACLGVVMVGLVLGSGCSRADVTAEPPLSHSVTEGAETPVDGALTVPRSQAEVHHNDHDHADDLPATPEPVPTWDSASRAAAAQAAELAVAVYAADLEDDSWWRGLAPLLTPTAQVAYVGTDPSNVPIGAVTAPAVVVPEDTPSPYLARVQVYTDVGTYGVVLVRTAGGEPWLVERFHPAAGEVVLP